MSSGPHDHFLYCYTPVLTYLGNLGVFRTVGKRRVKGSGGGGVSPIREVSLWEFLVPRKESDG